MFGATRCSSRTTHMDSLILQNARFVSVSKLLCHQELLARGVNTCRRCFPFDKVEGGPPLSICFPGGLNFNHFGHRACLRIRLLRKYGQRFGKFQGSILRSGTWMINAEADCSSCSVECETRSPLFVVSLCRHPKSVSLFCKCELFSFLSLFTFSHATQ